MSTIDRQAIIETLSRLVVTERGLSRPLWPGKPGHSPPRASRRAARDPSYRATYKYC